MFLPDKSLKKTKTKCFRKIILVSKNQKYMSNSNSKYHLI